MKKILKCFLLIFVLCMMVSGCGFFEEEAEGVKDIEFIVDELTQDVLIRIVYYDEDGTPKEQIIHSGIDGKDGNAIKDVTCLHEDDTASTKITITFTDEEMQPQTFYVNDGVRITNIREEVDQGTGNTYMYVQYSDGSESDAILVPEGKKGKDGRGIESITSEKDEEGNTKITIKYTDNKEPVEFVIPVGKQGNGIQSITPDETGGSYTLNITFDNGEVVPVVFSRPSLWYSGYGHPNDGIPSEYRENVRGGDYYLDIQFKTIYRCISYNSDYNRGEWVDIINFNQSEEKYTVTFMNLFYNVDLDLYEYAVCKSYYNVPRGTYFYGNTNFEIPSVALNGWKLEGWYTKDEITPTTGRFTDLTAVTSDLTLYAIYTPETYSISFYDEDGETKMYDDLAVRYRSTIDLPNPTKEGYTFDHWDFEGALLPDQCNYNWAKNIRVVARWTKID